MKIQKFVKFVRESWPAINWFELSLPALSLAFGLGILRQKEKINNLSLFINLVIFFSLIEAGTQIYSLYINRFLKRTNLKPEEKSMHQISTVLFFALSLLPLSRVLILANFQPAYLLVVSGCICIQAIWRHLGAAPFNQMVSLLLYSLNNAFLLPLTQLMLVNKDISAQFLMSSQLIFLILTGFLLLREIQRVELSGGKSAIVGVMGTIPLLKISITLLAFGLILLGVIIIRQPAPGFIVMFVIIILIFIFLMFNFANVFRLGKRGLANIIHAGFSVMVCVYLALLAYLWVY